MSEFNSSKYKNDFAKEKYDRLNIQVYKGMKAKIEEHRKTKGYKSLNDYINDLIRKDMDKNESAHSVSVGDVNITQGDGNTIHIG